MSLHGPDTVWHITPVTRTLSSQSQDLLAELVACLPESKPGLIWWIESNSCCPGHVALTLRSPHTIHTRAFTPQVSAERLLFAGLTAASIHLHHLRAHFTDD